MELGYARQKVKRISGTGRERIDDNRESWEGEWGMKMDKVIADWGSINLTYPTNYWEGDSRGQKVRDFILDLSGFQFRFGLYYRF